MCAYGCGKGVGGGKLDETAASENLFQQQRSGNGHCAGTLSIKTEHNT